MPTATTATYTAGGIYSKNESKTLYAVWKINPYIPTGYTLVEGTDLNNGFTVQDSLGNQYVWVEVPKTEEVYPTAGLIITEFTTEEYTAIENDLHSYTSVYRKYTDTYYSDAATGLTETQYNELKQKMLKSVYQNGGFYVGKYETGIDYSEGPKTSGSSTVAPTETPVIKQNTYPYNFVTPKQAQTLASGFTSQLDGYTSSLLFGVQWDLVLKYLETKGATQYELDTNSTNWGNYYDNLWNITNASSKYAGGGYNWTSGAYGKKTSSESVLLSTGASDTFCKQGIYDLAGNVWEWTMANGDSTHVVVRGGVYSASTYASHGNGAPINQCRNIFGFRVSLYKDVEHGPSDVMKEYKITETGHIPVYTCTYPECTEIYEGEEETHTGGTHENSGTCTVSGCGYKYQTHAQSKIIKEYKKTATGHTPVYSCTYAGCAGTYTGTKEAHTGGTHENDGTCTVSGCGYKYQTHSQSRNIKEYKTTSTGHTPVYKCTEATCTTTYDGTEEAHIGGTHENDGTCTVEGCGYKYQTHEQSENIKEYKTTATGHVPVYKCTEASCTTTYDGEEEAHTGGTHENDGTCTVEGCGYKYQTHEQSENIKEYKTTETGHTPVYKCTEESCTITYDGIEEDHTGGTHENDGTCTVEGCGYKYQTHEQSDVIKEYKTSANGHTPVYTCTYSECTGTFNGEEEAHTGGTHENGGVCTVEGCGYKYQTHEQSDVIKEYKITETGHIPVYKCTEESCEVTYEGTEEPHNNETYVDNGDGTHSSTCAECGEITTENHNYENGECKDCKSEEPPISVETEKYEILEAYITQIQPETAVNTFRNDIVTDATEINIYNHNNELLKDDDIIGTGMKLELKKGTQIKSFTLIVRGDVDGDGTSGMVDILKINKHRLNKKNLEEIYLKAGDVTDDGKVDFFDIIKINRYRLHKITKL